jgi:hypothetical protein
VCKDTKYCSQECQQADRKEHKLTCTPAASERVRRCSSCEIKTGNWCGTCHGNFREEIDGMKWAGRALCTKCEDRQKICSFCITDGRDVEHLSKEAAEVLRDPRFPHGMVEFSSVNEDGELEFIKIPISM